MGPVILTRQEILTIVDKWYKNLRRPIATFLVVTPPSKMIFLPLLLLFSLLQPTHTTSVHDSSSILLAKNTDSLLATIRQAEATTQKLKLKKATASPEEDLEAEISSLKVRLKASPTSCSVVGTQKMEYSFMNGTMLVETIFFFRFDKRSLFLTPPLYPPPQI